ncbi:hypothetical protein CU007_1399 [Enterococcus faecium]|nr:hypothetical protein [Enterococcus faecium]MBK4872350.1 hypothetical protein [Enterococcus faecium]
MTEELAGEHRLFKKRDFDTTFVKVPSVFYLFLLQSFLPE